MSDVLFLSVTGLFALALQSTSFGFLLHGVYKPELMIMLVVWASLRTSFLTGAGFAFISGLFVDLLSGSPAGLWGSVYMIVFMVCGYCQATLDIDYPLGRALTVFFATLAAGCAVTLVRWVDAPAGFGWQAISWIMVKSFITALTALIIFPIMDRVWAGISAAVGVR